VTLDRTRAAASKLRTTKVREKLVSLYGRGAGEAAYVRLEKLLVERAGSIRRKRFQLTEKDAVFVTYGDGFLNPPESPLSALSRFLCDYLRDLVTIVHILPFFPFSSDDGFSVVDYRSVNPALGGWADVSRIGRDFTLMFDAVINHISARSSEFQAFLRGSDAFRDFFIPVTPETDVSKVFRPRNAPLSTRFETRNGPVELWTTFGGDQVDLDYRNPAALLYIIDVILFYLARGAAILRLDAIAFLWKESGSRCLHLPQTHLIVKLLREFLRVAAPHAKIITETNVPHEENLSYFGSGADEAHLVYNFALPPLAVHTLLAGDARLLSSWARSLETPGDDCHLLNFTASHDGIGLAPAQGILPGERIEALVDFAVRRGGGVSRRDAGVLTPPYELNISLFDLISDPRSAEPLETAVSRFVASQAIALSLKGLPAVYYHSLVGSGNYQEGVERTDRLRSINREKLDLARLREELETPGNRRSLVYSSLAALLRARRSCPAFHPNGRQRVLELDPGIFAVERTAPRGGHKVLSLVNVTGGSVRPDIGSPSRRDILTGKSFSREIRLLPYQVLWLES
jgi:sucrose phosphorylase